MKRRKVSRRRVSHVTFTGATVEFTTTVVEKRQMVLK
jgi:hypothetical protein